MAKVEVTYCDNCGDPVQSSEGQLKPHQWYAELPWDTESAGEGESGVVCMECVEALELER